MRAVVAAGVLALAATLGPIQSVAAGPSPPPAPLTAAAAGPAAGAGPIGFGRATTGGEGPGCITRSVFNLADAGPGTLRQAAAAPGCATIRFSVSGTITLLSAITVGANKTIDGSDVDVTLTNRGLLLTQPNVIIRNLRFVNFNCPSPCVSTIDSPYDAILVSGGTNVWIDHNDMRQAVDKLVGVARGPADLTISNNHFSDQGSVMQFGTFEGQDASKDIRATVYGNYFDHTGFRNPRVHSARVHAFNNFLDSWQTHGMSSVCEGELASEANVFRAGPNKAAILTAGGTAKDYKCTLNGFARDLGSLFEGGAVAKLYRPDLVFDPRTFYDYTAEPATPALAEQIAATAGKQR